MTGKLLQGLGLAVRVLLGVWFVYNGGIKIFGSGLDRFTTDIANYRMVSAPWDAIAAYSIPWTELIAGVCLMLGILTRGAILALTGLVVSFSFAIAWAWFKGLDISCGCRGGDEPIQYWSKVAEFAGYFIILAWLWNANREAEDESPASSEVYDPDPHHHG